jgi:hypothetical protein
MGMVATAAILSFVSIFGTSVQKKFVEKKEAYGAYKKERAKKLCEPNQS